MKSIGLVMMLAIVGMIPAHGEIFQVEPIKDQYTFGTTVTINGSSDQDLVFVKIYDESGKIVEILQLIASGQFLGVSMITPSMWHQGIYTIEIDDGTQTTTNTFEVVNELKKPQELNYYNEFGGSTQVIVSSNTSVTPFDSAIVETTSLTSTTLITNNTPITSSTSLDLAEENKQLKAKIQTLENQIANLKQLILEQVKVIYDWVIKQ